MATPYLNRCCHAHWSPTLGSFLEFQQNAELTSLEFRWAARNVVLQAGMLPWQPQCRRFCCRSLWWWSVQVTRPRINWMSFCIMWWIGDNCSRCFRAVDASACGPATLRAHVALQLSILIFVSGLEITCFLFVWLKACGSVSVAHGQRLHPTKPRRWNLDNFSEHPRFGQTCCKL